MNWTEVTIITTPEACEAVCGLLSETGVGGVSIEDPTLLLEENRVTHDWDVLDDEVTNRYRENKAVIKAYYPPDTNMEDKLLLIRKESPAPKNIWILATCKSAIDRWMSRIGKTAGKNIISP